MAKKGGHWGDKGTKGDYISIFRSAHWLALCDTTWSLLARLLAHASYHSYWQEEMCQGYDTAVLIPLCHRSVLGFILCRRFHTYGRWTDRGQTAS